MPSSDMETRSQTFKKQGFLIIKNALSPSLLSTLKKKVHHLDQTLTQDENGPRHAGQPLEIRNALAVDHDLLPLITHPKTFDLVTQIMGPHIHLVTSHILVRPPTPNKKANFKFIHWHQDGPGNFYWQDMPTQPWLYTKVGFYLTDTTAPNCAGLKVVPGSHKTTGRPPAPEPEADPYGTVDVNMQAGDAVIFDNRLWHAAGPNYTQTARQTLYLAYGYRVIRPIDYIQQSAALLEKANPVQQQLLGKVTRPFGYYVPKKEDLPLGDLIK